MENSRSTVAARQGLARLRKILDQLALEAAEAGNDMEGMEHGCVLWRFHGISSRFHRVLWRFHGIHPDFIGFYGDFMGFYGDFNGI